MIEELKKIEVSDMSPKNGIVVDCAATLYRKTKDELLGKAIVSKAEEFVEDYVGGVNDRKEFTVSAVILYEAYKISGDEKFKDRIIQLEKSECDMGLAFDMMYETAFGGKEHYHQLTVKAGKRVDEIEDDDCAKAMFMMTLVDTIEAIDQPVYELYRSLVDLFRTELKKIIAKTEGKGYTYFAKECANKVMACAVKKACDMKVILAEKYEAGAKAVFEDCDEDVFSEFMKALSI